MYDWFNNYGYCAEIVVFMTQGKGKLSELYLSKHKCTTV